MHILFVTKFYIIICTDSGTRRKESPLDRFEQVGLTNISSEKETSNNLFVERTNAEEGFPACVDRTIQISEGCSNDVASSQNLIEGHNFDAETTEASLNSFCLPKSAHAFLDAIRKNRSCQKVMRDKMMQTEARLEELKKLTERVKILKSFQLTCKKRMGRALSQKRDARVQLISLPKQRFSSKVSSANCQLLQALLYITLSNCILYCCMHEIILDKNTRPLLRFRVHLAVFVSFIFS